jgi:hypothetical protein
VGPAGESVGQGNWEKVQSHGVKGRTIFFEQHPHRQDQTLEVTFEGEFDEKCEEGEFGFMLYFYPFPLNPLDDDPVGGVPGTMWLRRIPTE